MSRITKLACIHFLDTISITGKCFCPPSAYLYPSAQILRNAHEAVSGRVHTLRCAKPFAPSSDVLHKQEGDTEDLSALISLLAALVKWQL